MREVFQQHLPALDDKIYHLKECHLSRVRYRRGSRCVLQYTLHIAETATGYEQIQWVTGVMYAGDIARTRASTLQPVRTWQLAHRGVEELRPRGQTLPEGW
jgi:hypothetical protein